MSDVGRRRRCSGGRPCGRGGRACGPDVAAEHRRRDEDRRRRRPCARGRLGRRSDQARVIEAGAMGQRGRQRRRSRGVEQGEGGGGRRWGIWHERGRTQRCLDEGGGRRGEGAGVRNTESGAIAPPRCVDRRAGRKGDQARQRWSGQALWAGGGAQQRHSRRPEQGEKGEGRRWRARGRTKGSLNEEGGGRPWIGNGRSTGTQRCNVYIYKWRCPRSAASAAIRRDGRLGRPHLSAAARAGPAGGGGQRAIPPR